MFAIMNSEVEFLAESDLALPAFELVLSLDGHVLIPHVVLH